VLHDLKTFFENIAPEDTSRYSRGTEGLDDMLAHIRSALTDVSLNIPVQHRRPVLGT
jgi:thiamine phosphate synthase YjbQ (UPF0047 family)